MCVFTKLHITAQSGQVIYSFFAIGIACNSPRCMCVCVLEHALTVFGSSKTVIQILWNEILHARFHFFFFFTLFVSQLVKLHYLLFCYSLFLFYTLLFYTLFFKTHLFYTLCLPLFCLILFVLHSFVLQSFCCTLFL